MEKIKSIIEFLSTVLFTFLYFLGTVFVGVFFLYFILGYPSIDMKYWFVFTGILLPIAVISVFIKCIQDDEESNDEEMERK